jgi:hypothetical protein
MATKHQDKIILGLALLLVAGGAFGAHLYREKKAVRPLKLEAINAEVRPYRPQVKTVEVPPTQSWIQPGHQKSGPDWIYEVFTSPFIYYDKAKGELVAVPPVTIPKAKPFGLDLVRIIPGKFRLQLVGDKGGEAIFQDLENRDTIIIKAGRGNDPEQMAKLAKLNLELREFQVSDVPMDSKDPTSSRIRVATAIVADTKTGSLHTLTDQKPVMGGRPTIILKVTDVPGTRGPELEPMKIGDTYTAPDGAVFTIDSVTDEPATVIVTRRVPGQPDRTLPLAPLAPKPPRKTESENPDPAT